MFIHELLEDTSSLSRYDVEPMYEEFINEDVNSLETIVLDEAAAISDTAVGLLQFDQIALVNEDVLNEGTFKNIFDKIINAIKNVWAKIKAFFAKLFKSIAIAVLDINKALKDIDKYLNKDFSEFEYEGYDWNASPQLETRFKNNCSKAINEQKKMISNVKFGDNVERVDAEVVHQGNGQRPMLPPGRASRVYHSRPALGTGPKPMDKRRGLPPSSAPEGPVIHLDTELFLEDNDMYDRKYKLTDGQQLGYVYYGNPKEATAKIVSKEIKEKYRKSENKITIKNFNKGESLESMVEFLRGFNKNKTLISAEKNANIEFKELLDLCDEAKEKSEKYVQTNKEYIGKSAMSTANANLISHCQIARGLVSKYNYLMSILIGLEKEKFSSYRSIVGKAVRYSPKSK